MKKRWAHEWSYLRLSAQIKLSLILIKSPHHEGVWGSGGIVQFFLDLGSKWRWVVRFTPRPLYPRGKNPGIHWIGGWVGPRAGLDAGANNGTMWIVNLRFGSGFTVWQLVLNLRVCKYIIILQKWSFTYCQNSFDQVRLGSQACRVQDGTRNKCNENKLATPRTCI
jgi:hypothetical protein